MNTKLDEQLVLKYPKIFKDRHADMKSTCMCWGFECGDGWYMLLNLLCRDIQEHIDNIERNNELSKEHNEAKIAAKAGDFTKLEAYWSNSSKEFIEKQKHLARKGELCKIYEAPQITAVQVKEKFGGLRFYFHGGDKFIQGLVSFAESMSYHICETCGTTLEVGQTEGWIRTICRKCLEELQKENSVKSFVWNKNES